VKRLLVLAALLAVGTTALYGYTLTRREQRYRMAVVQGDAAIGRGDTFAAAGHFGDAIALKPDSMLGYLKRGEAHRRRGDFDAAAADLERATHLDPTAPRAFELLGDVEAGRQDFGRAAERYAMSLSLDDGSPRVLYKLGLARHLVGEVREASVALQKAVSLDARFAEAHYLLGVCLRETNKTREAEEAFKRALALAPSLLAAREQLADLYGATGRRSARLAELERLLSADPGPVRQSVVALAYAASGETTRAVRILGSAAALYPDDAEVYLTLGRVWLDVATRDRDRVALGKAIEALQHAVSMEPSSSGYSALGRARLAAQDPALAERTLRQGAETLPADSSSFLHLADAAERNGHTQAARRALLDYSSLVGSSDGRARAVAERIGNLSLRLGEAAVAVEWLKQAAEGQRGTPALLARLALAQIQAGDRVGARVTLGRMLERDPDGRGIDKRLQSLIADR
jgi:tetratricopeptide (TPR) repeat protein